jgi:hypothetical protein
MLGVSAGLVAVTAVGAAPAMAAPDQHNAKVVKVAHDRDRDGIPNRRDRDRDGDGIRNSRDPRPNQPSVYRYDRDRDGIPNWRDRNDGHRPRGWGARPNVRARYANDLDRDGIPNARDRDRDGDGVRNSRDRYPNNPRRR